MSHWDKIETLNYTEHHLVDWEALILETKGAYILTQMGR